MRFLSLALLATSFTLQTASTAADVQLPQVFSDHMVLQQQHANPMWGKAAPGEAIEVIFAGKNYRTQADSSGQWRIELDPLAAGGPYQIKVRGKNSLELNNVMVGEVWLCSGQSNMEWRVKDTNHSEVELASANYPDIRLFAVPRVGASKPQFDIDANWQATTPESVGGFSAVCYFYGRRLHQTLGVPVGLIKNSWGGTPIEAWIPRESLDKENQYTDLLTYWDQQAESFTQDKFDRQMADFNAWNQSKKPKGKKPSRPIHVLGGGKRPANIFNGVVSPTVGYGIRGAIWYQGEANQKRGYQYRSLFPLLINSWRERWGQGDFPFYWVQLADFKEEIGSPSGGSDWAEVREAQTMALNLPNTGQTVIFDLGEGRNIHPTNKQDVANRLVRHPLAKIHGYPIVAESPMFKNMVIKGNKAVISFSNVQRKLYAFDTKEVHGFYIAGEDQHFVKANARIVGKNRVELSANEVANPVAVRYGWEDNPIINLYDKQGLPVAPFRTDDWPLLSRYVTK